jgi:hypothetical protein
LVAQGALLSADDGWVDRDGAGSPAPGIRRPTSRDERSAMLLRHSMTVTAGYRSADDQSPSSQREQIDPGETGRAD